MADLIWKVVTILPRLLSRVDRKMRHATTSWSKKQRAEAARKHMVRENSAYYEVDEAGGKIDGPFCQTCFDADYQKVHLIPTQKPDGQLGRPWQWVQCPQCKLPFRSRVAGQFLNAQPSRRLG